MNSVISDTPGPGRRREGTRAVPAGADDDADRRDLVFGLDDRELVGAGRLVDAELAAVLLERFGERRARRDRVPGADRGAAVDAAERRGGVAFDEDAVADRVAALDLQAEGVVEVLVAVMQAHHEGIEVGLEQLGLALVLLAEQRRDDLGLDAEHRRQHADIDDVLEQLALARVGVARGAQVGERNAEDMDVVAKARRRHRLGAVVEEIAAGLELGEVLVPGLRVHRHHQVDAAAPRQVAALADAHLVPGRQALDVRREDVARADRHAHAQEAPREQLVRRRRARAVDVRELDDEIVDGFDPRRRSRPHVARHVSTGTFLGVALRQPLPARVCETVNFCMSQAPVGQRSAHSPQCRQTSSSLTMTRPVLRASETYSA